MTGKFYLIRESSKPRRIEIQPVATITKVGIDKLGYYMLNTFGEPLRTNTILMVGRLVTIEDYAKEFKAFLRANKSKSIIEDEYGNTIKCKELLRVIKTADFIPPHKIDARGKVIV